MRWCVRRHLSDLRVWGLLLLRCVSCVKPTHTQKKKDNTSQPSLKYMRFEWMDSNGTSPAIPTCCSSSWAWDHPEAGKRSYLRFSRKERLGVQGLPGQFKQNPGCVSSLYDICKKLANESITKRKLQTIKPRNKQWSYGCVPSICKRGKGLMASSCHYQRKLSRLFLSYLHQSWMYLAVSSSSWRK